MSPFYAPSLSLSRMADSQSAVMRIFRLSVQVLLTGDNADEKSCVRTMGSKTSSWHLPGPSYSNVAEAAAAQISPQQHNVSWLNEY